MGAFPTYAYGDDGQIVAFDGNHVIAKGIDFEKVSETAEEYFNALRHAQDTKVTEKDRHEATHIVTPNGNKGAILGRTSAIFSDSITVRFENGQIRSYDTFVGDGLTFTKEAADTPKSPVEYFQRRLDEVAAPGRKGLTARLNELDEVRRGAAHLASQGVSYTDGQALHQIVLSADAERNEVREALDHLTAADAEAMTLPTLAYSAVEQADLGRSDSWLEVVAQEMVEESEAQDFDKLLAEGPIEFVSGLDIAALANTGVVRDMAVDHIHSKTAGFQGEAVEHYRDQFVANAELARKRELTYRKDNAKASAKKEAKVTKNVPDEALFL